jgi:N-acetylmuramoyl-L-alanine amidase
MFKIALDAGHGRNTAGKRCLKKIDPNQTREWVLNARICDKIEAKLKEYEGYQVLRVDDTTGAKDISLAARCKAANNFKANIYLSIHHNAGINGGAGGGITAYTWKKPNAELQKWQKMFYDALIAKTGLKGNRATPLAKSNFYVLVNTNMQALLVENGFMDSTKDVPIILSEDFADKAATAYVETLAKIGGLKKKPKPESQTIYRVQVGAYSNKVNAEETVKKLQVAGYQAIIVEVKK